MAFSAVTPVTHSPGTLSAGTCSTGGLCLHPGDTPSVHKRTRGAIMLLGLDLSSHCVTPAKLFNLSAICRKHQRR